MSFLLDTNIVILASERSENVLRKFAEHGASLVTSALCLVELRSGLHVNPSLREARLERLAKILPYISVLPFGVDAVLAYDAILAARGWSRSRYFDYMIAGHALSTRSTLVTNNVADFAGIPGLAVENWADA